ncbi:MAG: hypothetical protein D6722_24760, partial [Bacteroidetes bacterium]
MVQHMFPEKKKLLLIAFSLTLVLSPALRGFGQAVLPPPAEVKAVMQRVADWQMAHVQDLYSGRPTPHHPLAWTSAAFYVGLEKWARIADDGRYDQFLTRIGQAHDWQLHERRYHADDHAVGQMYLALYEKVGQKDMLRPTQQQFEYILAHPAQT